MSISQPVRATTQAAPRRLQRYRVVDPSDAAYPRRMTVGSRSVPDPLDELLAGVVERRAHGRVRLASGRQMPSFTERTADDEPFFTHQAKRGRRGTYYAKGNTSAANIVRPSKVPLHVSEDLELAVDAVAEAKTFFASAAVLQRIKLGGEMRLDPTGRSLEFEKPDGRRHELLELQPTYEGATGVDVRTPQDCQRMAQRVSGKEHADAGKQQLELTAALLDAATKNERWVKALEQSKNWKQELERMSVRLAKLSAEELDRLRVAAKRLSLNEHIEPRVSAVLVTLGSPTEYELHQADVKREPVFPYHYGTVVATSGIDFIAMENYARRDPRSEGQLQRDDPLFFFRMYSSAPAQTWHDRQRGDFLGMPLSFVVH